MSFVTQRDPKTRSRGLSFAALRKSYWVTGVLLALALLSLPWLLSPDGQTHGSWQQFLGRFHPLVVHLPIGLILLLPVLEFGGRFRSAWREAASVVLGCAVLCSAGAVVFGMLLAHGGGFSPDAVRIHMWGGLFLCLGVIWCALIRPSWAMGRVGWVYPASLIVVLILTAWTGHQGGSLIYGKTYLTEFAPAFIKRLQPQKNYPPVDPASVYAMRVQPILDSNCLSCHSGSKIKGGLQLDNYAHVMDGGNDGEVVSPGHAEKSLLLTRITLPADHPKFMPSEGKPLAAKDIAWIKGWIQQGASPKATALPGMEVRAPGAAERIPQVGDYNALTPQMIQIEKTLGIRLDRVSSKAADGLILRTIDVAPKFGDSDLARLEPFAPYIVNVELGHTKVTDACFASLAKFNHARAIHLEDTSITGRDLQKLAVLHELRYLNLSSTRVTHQALDQFASVQPLLHIYAFNTPAQPSSSPIK
ncbi:c-type cytochrome domain-containing protein [Edaphobacter modestus]|uniref:Putative membrane protein n=1 Tax=Edaphobacter modestus TaxID=388466 RepID=A0A4Q7XZ73_9BACT|nr:c-type cytochrome domain-containing protein [Edaphobacter modestus]RZU29727.1 putative membrane protein [Edaphobacter modestus]